MISSFLSHHQAVLVKLSKYCHNVWRRFGSEWGKTDFGFILPRLNGYGCLPPASKVRDVSIIGLDGVALPHSRLVYNFGIPLDLQLLKEQVAALHRFILYASCILSLIRRPKTVTHVLVRS